MQLIAKRNTDPSSPYHFSRVTLVIKPTVDVECQRSTMLSKIPSDKDDHYLDEQSSKLSQWVQDIAVACKNDDEMVQTQVSYRAQFPSFNVTQHLQLSDGMKTILKLKSKKEELDHMAAYLRNVSSEGVCSYNQLYGDSQKRCHYSRDQFSKSHNIWRVSGSKKGI